MQEENVKKLVQSALFAALCTVMTMVIQVPSPMQGYVNLGDCAVLMSAWVLGPIYGGAAAGIGSMMADVLSGYAHYAPGTLLIKLVMAVVAASLLRLFAKRPAFGQFFGGVAAEIIMVVGYFGYASLWLGKGMAAAASIPGNVVQGIFGLIAAMALYGVLAKTRIFERT